MKYALITLFLLGSNSLIAQSTDKMVFDVDQAYQRDSIQLENRVEFYTYSDQNTSPTDAVRFMLKVTNKGNRAIPNLKRVSNRMEHLKICYNDNCTQDMNMVNGIVSHEWPWHLKRGESDTFETGYVLLSETFHYGDTVQLKWQYLDSCSDVISIDFPNKRILK